MHDDDIDHRLRDIAKCPPDYDRRAFEAGVWSRIDTGRAPLVRRLPDWQRIVPALGWRAAPAALALVVGALSGAVLVGPAPPDDLAVFRVESPYSLVTVVDPARGAT